MCGRAGRGEAGALAGEVLAAFGMQAPRQKSCAGMGGSVKRRRTFLTGRDKSARVSLGISGSSGADSGEPGAPVRQKVFLRPSLEGAVVSEGASRRQKHQGRAGWPGFVVFRYTREAGLVLRAP